MNGRNREEDLDEDDQLNFEKMIGNTASLASRIFMEGRGRRFRGREN